jgi:hypothetical protein
VRIYVYSIKKMPDGSERVVTPHTEADYWNIVVRDSADLWIDGVEELTRVEEVDDHLQFYREKYPDAELEYE